MPDYPNDPALITLARHAVAKCARNALEGRASRQVNHKNGNPEDLVTNVDHANSAILRGAFQPYIEQGAIMVDEEKLPNMPVADVFADPAKLVIITDPIDGTKEFCMEDGKSWGVMLTLCQGAKPFFSCIVLPALLPDGWLELEINDKSGSVARNGQWNPIPQNPPTTSREVNISRSMPEVLQAATDAGFTSTSVYSAAEMTLNLATGKTAVTGMSHHCSIWDVAPIFHLAALNGYVITFKNAPHEPLTFGPHLFQPNWKLREGLVITTPAILRQLHPALAA